MYGVGRPTPRPSYSFFVASSRGESGLPSREDKDCGVAGFDWEVELSVDAVSSCSLPESTATTGTCDGAMEQKLSGRGRSLLAGVRGGERRSPGGGVILTLGEALEAARRPLSTELVFPRLQEIAASDLEGVFSLETP